MPTATQEQQILSIWGSVIPAPVFDFAYSWGVQSGDQALSTDPALQAVFAAHNALATTAPINDLPPPRDFNGDGNSDVLWRNSNGTVAEWLMNGSQITSGAAVTFQGSVAAPDASWSIAGTGDFNGDGKSDILWRNTNGTVAEWTMNGSQITSAADVTYQGSVAAPDASWHIAGVADLNGDGKSDILWRNDNGTVAEWTMNGSQITSAADVTYQGSVAAPDPSWHIVGMGDFGGNGTQDILWRDDNGTVAEWTMNGSQITSSAVVTYQGNVAAPDSTWQIAGIGDFDGDGKSDILWRNSNGTVAEWLMNGSQITSAADVTYQGNVAAPDNSWQIAEIGDFNIGGKSDILWRNSNGAVAEWTMNGSQITSAADLGAPDTSWSIQPKPF
jgi:hypothetical protein